MNKKKENGGINLQLSNELALTFNYFRSQVSNDRKKRASNVDVMIALFQAMKEKRSMESKMKSLQFKIDSLNGDIMVLLKESINRPINIQVGALAQATTQQQFIPPSPVKVIPGLAIERKDRHDLITEMKAKFIPENCVNGQLLPSKIIEVEEDE